MEQQLKIVISAEAGQAIDGVNKLKYSLQDLNDKLKAKQALLVTEKDLARIKIYQTEVKALEKEIEKTSKLTLGNTLSSDGLIKGVNGAFGALRKLAYILPGIGIAGLISQFSDLAVEIFGSGKSVESFVKDLLGLKTTAEKVQDSIPEIFGDAAKKSGESVAKLEIFKTKLNDLGISEKERVKVAKEYNAISDKQNQIDLQQINNLGEINKKIDRQNQLIVQRAVSVAATSKLGTFADKFVEADLKVQEALKESGQTEDQYLSKNKKFIDALTSTVKNGGKGLSSAQADMINSMGRNLNKSDLTNLFFTRQQAKDALDEATKGLSGLISTEGLTSKRVQDKQSKAEKSQFLFDFLPFDPNGNLKPDQKGQLLEAAGRFQKQFGKIIQGAIFTGTEDQQIAQAKKLDLDIKAGNVKFDVASFKEAFSKLNKDADIIPKDELQALSSEVVDQFVRGFQNESERVKGLNLYGDLLQLDSPESLLADFKSKLQIVGGEVPKIIEATTVQGNKIKLPFDKLFETNEVNVEGIKEALKNALGQIVSVKDQFQANINNLFKNFAVDGLSGFGEQIGAAFASGGKSLENAGKFFGDLIGNFIQSIGKQLIELGIVKTNLDKILASIGITPGPAVIAVGVGVVAIGALVKNLANQKVKGYAKGGDVPGVGNGDTVPAMLTPGEYVVTKDKAPLVKAFLKSIGGSLSLSKMLSGVQHFATGGDVIPAPNRFLQPIQNFIQTPQMQLASQSVNVNVGGRFELDGNTLYALVNRVTKSQGRSF